jgi:MFS transporter, DHA3 family, tetracycline resistance protein
MPEHNFRGAPSEGRSSLRRVSAKARGGARFVCARPVLRLLLAVAVFAGMSEKGFARLYAKQILDVLGLPSFWGLDQVVWFGVINAGALILSYFGAEVVGRRLDVGNATVATRLLLALNFLTLVGMLAFALAGSFAFALGAFWFASLVRTLAAEPLYLTWLNEGLEPSVRATVISRGSQSGALGEVSAGPVVAAIGNPAGVRAALTAGALTLSPALMLYARARHHAVEPGLECANRVEKSNRRY